MKKLSWKAFAIGFLIAGTFAACNRASDAEVADASEAQTPTTSAGETYDVVEGTSVVLWEGYKPGRTHTGTVDIGSGNLVFENDQLVGGSILLNMRSIAVTDLEPGKGKEKLEAHLKGTETGKENDFFSVVKHPTAVFAITKVTALANDPQANHMVYGNLALKGIERNIGFRASIEATGSNIIVTSPLFKIDRTEWDLKFMSNSFFDNLGDNFIEDEIGLSINLVAAKAG